ncbi:MAG: TonB-dependent receptor [Gemmatimonadales bacterium]
MKTSSHPALAGLFLLLALVPAPVFAQGGGRVVGKVVDAESGAPISTAMVSVEGTQISAISDLNGRYHLDGVPPGAQSIRTEVLGYAPKIVTNVQVSAGGTTTLDVSLESTAIEIEALTVTADVEAGATSKLLDTQRNAVAMVEAVGSQEISKSPDSDAAEVAGRVSGVTVSDGKYVFIRGLGERYSQTSLNGTALPSPEPEKEVVPLDLFPAEFLESLTTQKTYTPDRPGDFSGGTVEIKNRQFPDRFQWKFSSSTSANTESQFQDGFLDYAGSNGDFLALDRGARQIPKTVQDEGYGLRGNRLPNGDPATLKRLGDAFASQLNQFAPTTTTPPVNLGLGGSVGNRVELFGKDVGFLVAGNYDESWKHRTGERELKWRAESFDPSIDESTQRPNVDYSFDRGSREISWGGVANVSALLSPENQVNLQAMYNRNGEDEARTYTGANREDLGADLYSERLRFQARSLAWGQLSGEHQTGLLDSKLEWKFAAARATRSEPALRETIYIRSLAAADSDPFYLENVGESARYFYTDLQDDDLNGGVDLTIPLAERDAGGTSLKLGGAIRSRNRDFAARRYRWSYTSGTITNLDGVIGNLNNVTGNNPAPGQVQLEDIVEPGDVYGATDDRLAGYAMVDVPVTDRLRAVAGARVENYDLGLTILTGAEPDEVVNTSRTDVLPALSLTYALTEDQNLRLAASRTLDRPEFRELAPFQFTEASSLRQLVGNPNLDVAEITNLDAKWEWFSRPGEVLSVGAFYKKLSRPIEQVFIATASSGYSFQNAQDGHVLGGELTIRKRLDFLGGFASNVTATGNFSLIDSQVNVIAEGLFDPTNTQRRLEGQSPYVVNLNLVWQSNSGRTEIGTFYNVFGARIEAAGGSGVPDILEQPRHVVDLTFRHQLTNRLGVKLKAENLLDQPYRWEQSANGITRLQREYQVGQTISVGLSYGN